MAAHTFDFQCQTACQTCMLCLVPRRLGVMLHHGAIMNRLNWQFNRFPFEKNEVCCLKTKLTFVDSITEIFGPLLKGVRLVVFKRSTIRNVESFVASLEAAGISRIVLVPSHLRAVLNQVQ